jgi:antitoxin Phd
MRKIQLKDAKANLSAVVDQASRGKPSVITRHGKPEAVVLGLRTGSDYRAYLPSVVF